MVRKEESDGQEGTRKVYRLAQNTKILYSERKGQGVRIRWVCIMVGPIDGALMKQSTCRTRVEGVRLRIELSEEPPALAQAPPELPASDAGGRGWGNGYQAPLLPLPREWLHRGKEDMMSLVHTDGSRARVLIFDLITKMSLIRISPRGLGPQACVSLVSLDRSCYRISS